MSKYEIICACGDHVELQEDPNFEGHFNGKCLGCDRYFSVIVVQG
jgi:hypothetical protein